VFTLDAIQTTDSLFTQSLEDLRLAERIEHALHATGYIALRDIEIFVNARIVHLVGRVHCYHMKQVAQVTVYVSILAQHFLTSGLPISAKSGSSGRSPLDLMRMI
jgi:hypothetical protein